MGKISRMISPLANVFNIKFVLHPTSLLVHLIFCCENSKIYLYINYNVLSLL